jgi:DNA-binding MarR family transcriptional regulator
VVAKAFKQFYKPETYKLEESVVFLMVKNQLIFERIADQRLLPLGITASQMRVLMIIHRFELPTASQIASMYGSHAAAIVRTIDKLELKGWIKRIRSTTDRRVIHLSTTPKGRQLLEKIPEHLCEMLNLSLDGFDDEDFQLLKKLLLQIAKNNLQWLGEDSGDLLCEK